VTKGTAVCSAPWFKSFHALFWYWPRDELFWHCLWFPGYISRNAVLLPL